MDEFDCDEDVVRASARFTIRRSSDHLIAQLSDDFEAEHLHTIDTLLLLCQSTLEAGRAITFGVKKYEH